MKAASMGPKLLTLTLVIPLRKGTGLAPGVEMTPRSKTLWIQASTSTMLRSSEEGGSGLLGPRYVHIFVLCLQSGWIRWPKNIHRRCARSTNPTAIDEGACAEIATY
jgi:hypothetical protein